MPEDANQDVSLGHCPHCGGTLEGKVVLKKPLFYKGVGRNWEFFLKMIIELLDLVELIGSRCQKHPATFRFLVMLLVKRLCQQEKRFCRMQKVQQEIYHSC